MNVQTTEYYDHLHKVPATHQLLFCVAISYWFANVTSGASSSYTFLLRLDQLDQVLGACAGASDSYAFRFELDHALQAHVIVCIVFCAWLLIAARREQGNISGNRLTFVVDGQHAALPFCYRCLSIETWDCLPQCWRLFYHYDIAWLGTA